MVACPLFTPPHYSLTTLLHLPPPSPLPPTRHSYKSDYPYAHTFISVIRDKNGRYSLADYNLFVPESAERKEDTNYIYQDTAHCVSPDEVLHSPTTNTHPPALLPSLLPH